jgi:hypothetical protein
MEAVEKDFGEIQELAKAWCDKAAGMGMGEYPKGILALRKQLAALHHHYKRPPRTTRIF